MSGLEVPDSLGHFTQRFCSLDGQPKAPSDLEDKSGALAVPK